MHKWGRSNGRDEESCTYKLQNVSWAIEGSDQLNLVTDRLARCEYMRNDRVSEALGEPGRDRTYLVRYNAIASYN